MNLTASILNDLRRLAQPSNLAGMARFGIDTSSALGVPIPALRRLARAHRRDHALALALWATGVHEARILASLVDDPAKVTASQMDAWVREIDSWDICDQVCNNLFNRTPHAWSKAVQWSRRQPEFVRRAGYVLMATLAVHDKQATDADFEPCFDAIRRGAADDRNFVKKAVNWALRQIGKRNSALRSRAIAVARDLEALDAPAARWIARDALRELRNRG
ncbi:MAG TPA: DNA alkylation repair protein [Kiritimatiellia bacterium]|nr:DNA alkylation repair protein [Kiritimatiellia bacterium]